MSLKCEELGAYKHTQTDQASRSLKRHAPADFISATGLYR